MYKSLFSGLVLIFVATIPIHAAVLLVPGEYSTIQEAINGSNNGDIVIVSPGTYVENINFWGKNITVTSTNPEDWDVVEATIIDGNNTDRVVFFHNNETRSAVLTGFTITHGLNLDGGGGIRCYEASPTITRNIIIDNHCQKDFNDGVYGTSGGGIYCYYSEAIITRNIMKNNTSYYGAGIRASYGETLISNNVITDNRAVYGGGAYIYYGGFLYNNTIINNDCSYETSDGLYNGYGSNLYVRKSYNYDYGEEVSNNIIAYGKTNYGVYYYDNTYGDLKFTNNNVWANENGNYYDAYDGGSFELVGINGNISEDPSFIDDYHIGTDSPCYNAGNPDYAPYFWQRDIDGEYAIMDSSVDIGADEVTGNPRPFADAGDDQLYEEIPAFITLDGSGSFDPCDENLTWEWQQTGGQSVTLSDSDTANPSFVPLVKDVYYFQLRVFDGSDYSQSDTVMIVVGNRAPIADAGSDRFIQPYEKVTLSGNASYDLDVNDILSYSWTQISGPSIELSDPNLAYCYITPTVIGEYVFQLVVNDGEDSSLPDTVKITCKIGSEPDAYGYSWIDSDNAFGPAYYWQDIQNSRNKFTNIEGTNGRVLGAIYLDFDFNFYGTTYRKLYLQSSGVISFGPDQIYNSDSIPSSDGYDNMIAWMWTNMELTSKSKVYYKSYPDHMIIQFVDWSLYSDYGTVNAQVILYKSGKIIVQYKDYTKGENGNMSYVIGIENSDGTIGTEVVSDRYDYIHDGLAIEFSTGGGPYEPVAHAGPDQQHKVAELITLDGSA
ncbi:MAG: right-handed parallel beta-helix repeat-containing protein, partial [Bacteroidales bacterium]|nr:right-handed parallel beta-helix repeat-containing protein [Bacteroidales bacterium]